MLPQKDIGYYYELAHKWSQGQLSEEELHELDNWYAAQALSDVEVPGMLGESEDEHAALLFLKIKDRIEARHNNTKHTPVSRMRWWWAAASVLLLATSAAIYLDRTGTQKETVALRKPVADIQPGSDGAVLTLGDGRVVVLDSLRNGWSANQAQSTLHLKEGQLQYNQGNHDGQVMINTLSTPRGRQFSLILPDGTLAWLNASSSITFPTAFTGKSREVSITGEVYFEVNKRSVAGAATPFSVRVNEKQTVEVLGTDFNINAYPEEAAVRTTLLSGTVRVSTTGQKALLKPGQQASVEDKTVKVSRANTDQAIAWKNGLFYFSERTGIKEVMRQIERWYDVQVVYEPGIDNVVLTGEMQRNLTLLQVIKGLDNMGVKYKLEGKVLRVSPASY